MVLYISVLHSFLNSGDRASVRLCEADFRCHAAVFHVDVPCWALAWKGLKNSDGNEKQETDISNL